MTSFYLAAPWANKERIRGIRDELIQMGHVVTSSWLEEDEDPDDHDLCVAAASVDLNDINAAHIFIVFTDEWPIGAGHHVELGYAMAMKKFIILVGPYKSIFHHLAHHHFDDWEACKKMVEAK